MTTHFITAEIDLQQTTTELQACIESELQKQGEPLRWAITAVDVEQQKVSVEAIVTVAQETSSEA
ncbi:hypothetical protein H6F98_20345 [Microcoleus sp. FACHB-SPT15]|uniref:hypothetical protein n=1 Tax=Microcoleus sp. FACHB-SPT15 TaxID=2692830 RepID=UPI00177B9EC7|nr:hypothetical protein [Microcoleus sp. FACHB-SPT15]MBD1807780.1 hypothetical protein [Microcoleus sp. FACHB-SPT15]